MLLWDGQMVPYFHKRFFDKQERKREKEKETLMSHFSEMPIWLRAIYVVGTMAAIWLVAWFAGNGMNWTNQTTKKELSFGDKLWRICLLIIITALLIWGVYWLVSFVFAVPIVEKSQFSANIIDENRITTVNWTKFFWRLGLSMMLVVFFGLSNNGLKNLFIDKRYFAKDKSDTQPSTIASFVGLTLAAVGGLMIVWLIGSWFIWGLVLICAWVLSGIVVVPLNEVFVPSMFNDPLRDNSDALSRARVVKILRTGISWSFRPLWLLGYQLIRLRNDLEVINAHIIPAKLSTKAPITSDPGPRVTVTYNEKWQYNEYPNAFLHLSPEDQTALQTAILSATDAYTQSYVQTVIYQNLETWRPQENDEFFRGLRELLKSFGVLLRKFQIVNIESEVEKSTDALAEERVQQQIADLRVDQENARRLRVADTANQALKIRVDGVLQTMGINPASATPAQREQALVQLRANEIASKDYLIPPGAQSGAGVNLLVQAPSSPSRR